MPEQLPIFRIRDELNLCKFQILKIEIDASEKLCPLNGVLSDTVSDLWRKLFEQILREKNLGNSSVSF